MKQNSDDVFRLQNQGSGALWVDVEHAEVIRHEILFEEDVGTLGDARVFVGAGIPSHRLLLSFGFACLVLGVLFGKAAWMQVVEGDTYRARADDNRFRTEIIPARRGIIRDRNGEVLAENIPAFHVRMREADLPRDPEERSGTIALVARIVGFTSDDIEHTLSSTGTKPDEWVEVARDVSYERALALQVKLPELSGVSFIIAAKRQYPFSDTIPSLSHVLGYVGAISPEEYAEKRSDGYRRTDEIGKTGIERSYEELLRGMLGERRLEVDSLGRPRAVVGDVAPSDGTDVDLTIDIRLQRSVEEALRRGMEKAKVTRASAIVMDVRDGSILSVVSLPAYDNNMFAGRVSSTLYGELVSNEQRPLFPRAWAGQFPSGSTIKPLIALAGLQEGIITPNTTVLSVGGIRVGPWFFPDWAAGGHGPTNVRRAIAWSVNTFFYYVGGGYEQFHGLGVDRLTFWMRAFGLGSASGIDVPGEAAGHVPSMEWKEQVKGERWYIGDTYNLSIGQGDLLVTPLQMARLTAVIANGGNLVLPYIVRGAQPAEPERVNAESSAWTAVRLGMRDTVTLGSGRALAGLPVPVAGKTGTAQWRNDRSNHAWFIGYAPFDQPEIAVVVLLEEGNEGSTYAVPVAGDIFRAWYALRGSR